MRLGGKWKYQMAVGLMRNSDGHIIDGFRVFFNVREKELRDRKSVV